MRRILSGLAVPIVFAAGLYAFQTVPFTVVQGVVYDRDSGQPISNVSIQIGGRITQTDGNGRFAIGNLPPDLHVLSAVRDGYRRERTTVDSRTSAGPTTDAEHGAGVVLAMARTGSVAGTILAPNGQPLRGVSVAAYEYTYDAFGERILTQVEADTPALQRFVKGGAVDDRGEFRIYNLTPGEYSLLVRLAAPEFPVYYPGATDPGQALPVQIVEGVETRLAALTPGSSIKGAVRLRIDNRSSMPSSRVIVQLRRPVTREVLATRGTVTGAMGEVAFENVPLGSYEATVYLSGVGASFPALVFSAVRMPVFLAGNSANLDVVLPPGAALRGDVAAAAGNRPLEIGGVRLTLVSNILPEQDFVLASGPDGRFAVDAMPTGLFRLKSVSGVPDGMCLDELRQGDRNVMRDGLLIEDREAYIQARLAAEESAIRGSVRTAAGHVAPNAVVALIPEDRSQTERYASVTADAYGTFVLGCVRPGAYRLYAWSELKGAAYRNAEFLSRYDGLDDGLGSAVTVGAGERLTAPLLALPFEMR